MKIGIIGAGPAGLTAAYQLTKAGCDVRVYEAAPGLGGLARTLKLWGQKVDLGPHRFFSYDKRVNQLWLEVVGSNYKMVDRLTRIYYGGKFYDYPLKAINALLNMGPIEAIHCVGSYLAGTLNPSRKNGTAIKSFEDWVVSRFGRRLFEMFFKSYSEKLWGISCQELDADFAAQRIKKFSLSQAILSSLGLNKRKHKTLVDQFAYPIGGTGSVYERMAEIVRSRGGEVHTSTSVEGIVHASGKVTGIRFPDGRDEVFDHVISTMPLTSLVKSFGNLPPDVASSIERLTFRNTLMVYLHVDAYNLFPDQWLYIHSPGLMVGRITNFRNWIQELYGDKRTTILALEYWCYENDPQWSLSDNELIALATREISSTGLLKGAKVLDGRIVRIPKCYPVYRQGYRELLAPIVRFLRGIDGISAIGRYGAFKYNNQDHSILMGTLAAENLTEGAHHDLWAVNTDYDSYQESTTISNSGLIDITTEGT